MEKQEIIATYTLLSSKNPVFLVYATWTGILMIKMLLMSIFTAVQRFRTKVSFLYRKQFRTIECLI